MHVIKWKKPIWNGTCYMIPTIQHLSVIVPLNSRMCFWNNFCIFVIFFGFGFFDCIIQIYLLWETFVSFPRGTSLGLCTLFDDSGFIEASFCCVLPWSFCWVMCFCRFSTEHRDSRNSPCSIVLKTLWDTYFSIVWSNCSAPSARMVFKASLRGLH